MGLIPKRYCPHILAGWLFSFGGAAIADQASPATPPGTHLVKIKNGDQVGYIRVQDSEITFSLPDNKPGYHPDQFDPRKTSAFANKQFTTAAVDYNHSAYPSGKKDFPVESATFTTNNPVTSSSTFPTFAATTKFGTVDLDKSYATRADAESGELFLGAARSNEVSKKEIAYNQAFPTDASSLASKSYQGRELEPEQSDLNKLNHALSGRMNEVPNRPLTIDEVKALINHDVKPNLEVPSRDQSKSLNDPGYEETPSPTPPARPYIIVPASAAASSNDSDSLPGPGEVAARGTEETPPPEPLPAK